MLSLQHGEIFFVRIFVYIFIVVSHRRKIIMKNIIVLLLVCFSSALGAIEEKDKLGSIAGQVIDGATQQPLIGANIIVVEKPTVGVTTDTEGNFIIKNLPVGEYSLRASIIGYKALVYTNVVVSTGRSAKVKIKMQEEAVRVGAVEVTADYFSNATSISPVSTIGLNGAEVNRSPGAAQDMQRVVQNLPGVANSNDQSNELIVRGGEPFENLTVMDYVEIPSTNHYPNQFNSGGPINMVNVDMIEDIRFSTGGFPAMYGDKLSSVMDVTLREGDRQQNFASNTGLHMAGVGTLMEGKINDGKGSWIFSARQSLLETLDKVTGISSLGLTAIPKYWDTQFKVVYDLSSTQKLLVNGIYGDDKIYLKGDPDELNDQKKNRFDSSSVQRVDVKSHQYAAGVSLKSLWNNGFSVLTLSGYGNYYSVDVLDDFTARHYDSNGKVISKQLVNTRNVFGNHSNEQYLQTKYEIVHHLFPKNEISAGVSWGTTQTFGNNVKYEPNVFRYDVNGDGKFDGDPVISATRGDVDFRLKFGQESKSSAYISDKFELFPRLTTTAGVRYDYFTYSKQGNVSPRFSASYELIPPSTKINFAYGEFYQTLPYPYYGDALNTNINKSLKNAHARHFVLGVEHILGDGVKASLEGYYKEYDDLPVSEEFVHSANKLFRSDKLLSIGKRTSKGIELFIQQKQVENFYGTLSFSYSQTRTTDPRVAAFDGYSNTVRNSNVGSYPSDYDFPLIVTLVGGKIVKDFRNWLDDAPFYLKYPSMLLPFSNDMEISFRFRYTSGKPYTPKQFVRSIQQQIGGMYWADGAWSDSDAINSVRYPDYQRLDIQWISRYHLEHYNVVAFISLNNVYNHKNIAMYQHASDGTIQTVYQFAFFPVGGVAFEF